jgi:hypothetical protein
MARQFERAGANMVCVMPVTPMLLPEIIPAEAMAVMDRTVFVGGMPEGSFYKDSAGEADYVRQIHACSGITFPVFDFCGTDGEVQALKRNLRSDARDWVAALKPMPF